MNKSGKKESVETQNDSTQGTASTPEMIAKFTKFSNPILLAKLRLKVTAIQTEYKDTDVEDIQAITEVLTSRGVKAEEIQIAVDEATKKGEAKKNISKDTKANLEAITKVKEPKEPKVPKEPKAPKEDAVIKIESEDPAIQAKINSLQILKGLELQGMLENLKSDGISINHIVFLQKGDVVSFEAAKNAPNPGELMTGTIVKNNELDKQNRKYCRVKVEGKGTFQKVQTSVKVLKRASEFPVQVPEVKEVKVKKAKAKTVEAVEVVAEEVSNGELESPENEDLN
jgi:hypothetical protein